MRANPFFDPAKANTGGGFSVFLHRLSLFPRGNLCLLQTNG